jgi:V/A-type H+-transporting ATPase subunit B
LSQGYNENRSIETTLDIGWEMLSILPEEELYRISKEDIQRYYIPQKGDV